MANSYLLPATGNWKLTTVVWPLAPGPWPLTCTNYYVRNYPPFLTNKANLRKSQMNVSNFITADYENKTLSRRGKNKPNSNPIQTQTNPIKANKTPKQTQNKPKQTQSQNPRRKKFTPPVDERRFGGNNTRANQGFRAVCVLQELHKMKIAKPQTEYV